MSKFSCFWKFESLTQCHLAMIWINESKVDDSDTPLVSKGRLFQSSSIKPILFGPIQSQSSSNAEGFDLGLQGTHTFSFFLQIRTDSGREDHKKRVLSRSLGIWVRLLVTPSSLKHMGANLRWTLGCVSSPTWPGCGITQPVGTSRIF